jgi:hypothetical protein
MMRDDAEDHVGFEHAAQRAIENAVLEKLLPEFRPPLDPGNVDGEERTLLRIEIAVQWSVHRVSFLYFTRCGMTESWPRRRILSFS